MGIRAEMKFLSYNLRNGLIREEKRTDAFNNWPFRRGAAIDLIRKADADILALQEDSDEQMNDIRDALKDSHTAYFDDAFYEADCAYNAIMVRNTLSVGEHGAFWIFGDGKGKAKVEGSICFRHATYVWIQFGQIKILVVNVHLDHTEDVDVKRSEIALFTRLLARLSGSPPTKTIVMGDFNSAPKAWPHASLRTFGLMDSAQLRNDVKATSLHWPKGSMSERIDYIWISEDLVNALEMYEVLDGAYTRHDGSSGHASDHSAVFVRVKL